MEAKWIEKKGKKIFFVDISNCKEKEQLETIKEGLEIIKKEPSQSILCLFDLTDAEISVTVNILFNDNRKLIREKTKAISVVGGKGVQDFAVKIFMSEIKRVASREEAFKWLLEQ